MASADVSHVHVPCVCVPCVCLFIALCVCGTIACSSASEAAEVLQGSLSESWDREKASEAALKECDTELADLHRTVCIYIMSHVHA
jgi:hypothetical protein